MKRLLGHMCEPTVLFLSPLCLFQRELELDMAVCSLAVWLGHLPGFLVEWVGSCHVALVPTCPGYGIWGGINVLMVLHQDHWNPVIINASRLFAGFWDILKGSAADLLDGTLKLRYCTSIFTMRFPLGLYPGSEMVVGKGVMLLLDIFGMQEVTLVRGSGLPGRHVPEICLMIFRI